MRLRGLLALSAAGSLATFALLGAPAFAQDAEKAPAEKAPEKKAPEKKAPEKKAPVKKGPEKLEQKSPKASGTEAKVALLIGDLRAEDYDTRQKALAGLVKIGAPAIPALRKAAKDSDPEVASLAQAALQQIGAAPRVKPKVRERSAPRPRMRGMRGAPVDPSEMLKRMQKSLRGMQGRSFDDLLKQLEKQLGGKGQNPRMKVWRWDSQRGFTPPKPGTKRPPWLRPLPRSRFSQTRTLAARLGLRVGPPSAALRAQLGIKRGEGLVVNWISSRGHAKSQGLQRYDVILAVEGRPVRTRLDLSRLAKGGKVHYYRRATLSTLATFAPAPAAKAPQRPRVRGLPRKAPTPPKKRDERDF